MGVMGFGPGGSKGARRPGGMVKAGVCPEPDCGMRILVVDRTGLIRRHSPRNVKTGVSWCPAGGTLHPDWADRVGP